MKFARYAIERITSTFVLLALISGGCFVLLDFVPGTFFDEMRVDPRVSADTVSALRAAHGLSQPALARYVAWNESALRGDFGISFASNRPVIDLLLPRLRNTLMLSIPSLLLAWLIGLAAGVWCAAADAPWTNRLANLSSTLLHTVPEVVLCSLALIAAARTGLFPVGGMYSPQLASSPETVRAWDLLRHMALPVLVQTALAVPPVFWHTRAAVLDVAKSPFVRSARAHGIGNRVLFLRHLLPAAANALISMGGTSIGALLSASLVTEVLFAWPGVGPLFLDAVIARDPYVIIAAVLCFAAVLIGGNLLADLALHYHDPRLRGAA